MRPVAGPQAEQAADMLKSWFTAKKAKKIDEHSLTIILSSLGFNVIKITFGSQKNKPCLWINITTEIIQERERCPVSYYGSNAKGSYRVLCVWERPTEEDLLNEIGDNFQGSPVIVFHFGRMTEKRRKDLARMCRERRRTFVVIDDVLMLYLCGERGSRLPRMFECSLPFTFLKPYTTTASLVPPEIFYGRRIERESIISPMGSCFIYGGRQLGKTALLRDVQRTFHSPTNGRIAIWLDLKTSGIGYNRPVDEIWTLIADEFKVLDIIPNNVPPQTRENKLLEYVQKWLEQDDKRHILLLLDEADRFLVIDGKKHAEGEEIGEFTRAALLKGLMDRTNRRFKVIFAGLHNVQRTTRLENHPLAHYGDPMCIGPLLDNGESREVREARALIEKPFASLGYYFEPRDLVFRILSQTNYYPSLIQLYCDHLLKHVTSSNNFTIEHHKSPPYTITSKHVEDAYRSQDLRRAIRERFKLTLDLNTRYRVIALAIALYSLEDDDRVSDGFSTAWIREQALTFFGIKGFKILLKMLFAFYLMKW
ncbi:MAG: hypothetical protein IPK14_11970 [Blastocatellia bacterium]|nr:hypothetical protein [Blastocatellia bacterium]